MLSIATLASQMSMVAIVTRFHDRGLALLGLAAFAAVHSPLLSIPQGANLYAEEGRFRSMSGFAFRFLVVPCPHDSIFIASERASDQGGSAKFFGQHRRQPESVGTRTLWDINELIEYLLPRCWFGLDVFRLAKSVFKSLSIEFLC